MFEPLCDCRLQQPIFVTDLESIRNKKWDLKTNVTEEETLRRRKRIGMPAQQWIMVFNARKPMKQRYHCNVIDERTYQHLDQSNEDGLYVSSVACFRERWVLILDEGT